MKIVNRSKVPFVLFKWLQQDFYDNADAAGTISMTTLIKPTQAVILQKRYDEKIEIDAASRFWSLLGQGVHAVLEKVEDAKIVPIERLKVKFGKHTVSGKFDLIYSKKLSDFKVTSAYTAVYGSRLEEWKLQLSGYRYLYWKVYNILLNDTGSIIGIFRDWQKSKVEEVGYPKHPITEMNIRLMSIVETEAWIKSRLKLLDSADTKRDSMLPNCSEEDRWMHHRNKRNLRCESFCDVSEFCSQFKRLRRLI